VIKRICFIGVLIVTGLGALFEEACAVTLQEDVVYGRAGSVELKMDIAAPDNLSSPVPAVVCIHGGAWQAGSKNDYRPHIFMLASLGYVAAAVSYRFAPEHPWPAQIEDVKCAVRYLRSHASDLHIDPSRIGALGHSAGGHLALLLGLLDEKDGFNNSGGNGGISSKVQAVVNLSGPTDLRTWRAWPEADEQFKLDFGKDSDGILADLIGTDDRNSDAAVLASPVSYIDAGDPPVLTFHGDQDPVVPVDQAETLHEALRKAGVSEELVVVKGAAHGFTQEQLMTAVAKIKVFLDKTLQTAGKAEAAEAPRFEDILKIDCHAHVFDDVPEYVAMLERTNMCAINICLYGNIPELLVPAEKMAEHLRQKYDPYLQFVCTFDLTRRNEPDYAQQVIAWVDECVEAGALMVKLWKEVGMALKKPDGSYLMPDDPLFDPLYAHLAKRHIPLLAHLADPVDAWRPLTPESPHYGYYSQNPEWHLYGREGIPSHERILKARDNIMRKYPDLIVVGAHFGSMTHDLDELGKRFDEFPNFYIDVAARMWIVRSYPAEQVRKFFLKYGDRILYGTDLNQYTEGGAPSEEARNAFAKSAEAMYRADFAYLAQQGTHKINNREVHCLNLPRETLDKIYHLNAQRLMPALSADHAAASAE